MFALRDILEAHCTQMYDMTGEEAIRYYYKTICGRQRANATGTNVKGQIR